jgi:2-polyprenyl-6-methoxyphenol hydroxylase-like FAD-dependent oxidoreductase
VLVEVPVGGVTVLRGALSRAVREAAEDTGVRFEFGKALSSVTEPNGEEPPRGTLLNAHTDRYRRQLLAVHQSDPPEVTRILEASGDIGAWPVYDILSLPAWYRGAVCLLGDAAHAVGPHVGQGAALALEDALVLAKCLRDIPDASHSFSTFEHMRRPRVEPVVKQSRRTGQQKAPAGWVGRKIRDLILPTFLKSSARAANELYRHAIDWEERVA